jgi:hypothetical protein
MEVNLLDGCFHVTRGSLFLAFNTRVGEPLNGSQLALSYGGVFCEAPVVDVHHPIAVTGSGSWIVVFGTDNLTGATGSGTWNFSARGFPQVEAEVPIDMGIVVSGQVSDYRLAGTLALPT